jgi:pimeloyl-ACP methyl ester carboxylesterase
MKSTVPAGLTRNEYNINGVDTVVYSGGSGRPVVYFHGGGTFHGFEFTRGWSAQFRVILPYHPGFGESGDAPSLTSMDDYLQHYTSLFERLGLDRFGLVGLSMGGYLAAKFTARYPGKVERLVLGAPVGIFNPEYPVPDFATLPLPEMMSFMVTELSVLEPYMPRTAEEIARFTADREREAKSTAQIFQAGMADPPLEQSLPRVKTPTLLLWGTGDRVLHVSLAQQWLELLPAARLELLEETGHLILDESQRARDIAAAFLAGNTGVGPG